MHYIAAHIVCFATRYHKKYYRLFILVNCFSEKLRVLDFEYNKFVALGKCLLNI